MVRIKLQQFCGEDLAAAVCFGENKAAAVLWPDSNFNSCGEEDRCSNLIVRIKVQQLCGHKKLKHFFLSE